MVYKSDIGNYKYTNNHAVKQIISNGGKINNQNYTYNPNGSIIQSGNKIIKYNSFNKPSSFQNTTSNKTTNYQRTIYINKDYEQITNNHQTTDKYFIYANGKLITIHNKIQNKDTNPFDDKTPTQIIDQTRSLHYDNLGSIDTITDGKGYNEVAERDY